MNKTAKYKLMECFTNRKSGTNGKYSSKKQSKGQSLHNEYLSNKSINYAEVLNPVSRQRQ